MDVSFKENRAQQKALVESRKLLKSTSVEVGLPESAPARSLWLLALHERGAPGAHIPPRPVIGPALAKEETQAAVADGLLSACESAARPGRRQRHPCLHRCRHPAGQRPADHLRRLDPEFLLR